MDQKEFAGFPSGARATAVPNVFFAQLLPRIDDRPELVVTLYALYALGRKKGYPRYVSYSELATDTTLIAALSHDSQTDPREALRRGLRLAVERGSLIEVDLDKDGRHLPLYFLNTESARRAAELVRQGRINLGLPLAEPPAAAPATMPPNIFTLYEENIGPLSPIITEELQDAAGRHPEEWIADAIAEAVKAGVRKWSYIAAILERWATEGRDDEKAGRDPQQPKDYRGGLYGHIVRH